MPADQMSPEQLQYYQTYYQYMYQQQHYMQQQQQQQQQQYYADYSRYPHNGQQPMPPQNK